MAFVKSSGSSIELVNPLPDMSILVSSNSATNKDTMSKIWKNGDTIIRLSRKHSGKSRNCLLHQNVYLWSKGSWKRKSTV